jgi:ribonuclease R
MFITEEKPEGEVIEVVERHKTDFVGVIDIQKTLHLYLQQILKCIQIFYSKDKIGEAEQGDVVLVHIEDWPKEPIVLGVIIKCLVNQDSTIQRFMLF